MHAERHRLAVTTAADGSAVAYTPVVTGAILSITYTKPGAGGFTDGVDFDVTLEATGEVLWDQDNVNASKTLRPVVAADLPTGAASILTERPIVAARDRVKVSIANGGDAKVGTFDVLVGG